MSTPTQNPNPTPSPRSRLDELLAAACNGNLTPDQTAELDALLLHDPKARLAYLHHLHVEAKLHRIFRSKAAFAPGETNAFQNALAAIVDPGASRLGTPASVSAEDPHKTLHDAAIMPALADLEDLAPSHENSPDPFVSLPLRRFSSARPHIAFGWMWPMAAVLFLTLSAALAFLVLRPKLSSASLAAAIDASWSSPDGSPPPALGQHLPLTPITLNAGLAHLLFDNGTDVIIQGPATFQITSSSQINLSLGQLTAHVPSPAIGFSIKTPHADVTDLGTEFGINVSPDLQTHAEVFTGKVRASASDAAHPEAAAPNRTLSAGSAVNIPDANKIEDAAPSPLSFVRPAQFTEFQNDGGTQYARWRAFSMELRTDPHLLAYYSFDKPPLGTSIPNEAEAALGHADATIQNAPSVPGRFPEKSALAFNGNDSMVTTNIPGTFSQLTCAAWIDFNKVNHEYTTLINSVLPKTDGATHFSLKSQNGILSTHCGIQQLALPNHWLDTDIPAPQLRSNLRHWQLIVMTCDLDHHVIRSWINGQPLPDAPLDYTGPLFIGPAEIGNLSNRLRCIDGTLDEFALWNRPLSTSEIQSMYDAGKP